MRLTLISLATTLGALAVGAAPAAAEPATYTVDPEHTSLYFRVNHLGFSRVYGRFNTMSGSLVFDPDDPAAGRIELVVESASIDTNHGKRDDHLRSPDFFNVAEFPEMAFRSTAIKVTGDATATVAGDFTLLGVTRPVAFDVRFNSLAPHPFVENQIRTGFSATGTLKRSEFGMTYGLDGLRDEVELFVETEAFR